MGRKRAVEWKEGEQGRGMGRKRTGQGDEKKESRVEG